MIFKVVSVDLAAAVIIVLIMKMSRSRAQAQLVPRPPCMLGPETHMQLQVLQTLIILVISIYVNFFVEKL